MYYYDLIVENKSRHTDELYTYGAEEKLTTGSVVSVHFGKGKTPKRGFVVRENPAPSFDLTRIKPILAVDEAVSHRRDDRYLPLDASAVWDTVYGWDPVLCAKG